MGAKLKEVEELVGEVEGIVQQTRELGGQLSELEKVGFFFFFAFFPFNLNLSSFPLL